MDAWKEFEKNPITHSAAHHLVAIAELLERYGYARVSDVARRLEITRGSASITLKNLKNRELVTEDERRFLGLSSEGEAIAASIRAKKALMMTFLTEILDVDQTQADIDTCKIEHLLSDATAARVAKLVKFVRSENPAVGPFLDAFDRFEKTSQEELLAYGRPGEG